MKTKCLKPIFASLIALLCFTTPVMSQIEAGTSVQISIMGVPSEEKGRIDGLYPVSESGTVNLPFINNVRAAGLRPENLAVVIQNAYKSAEIYNNPTIQVISTSAGSRVAEQMVTVGGQVRRTGPIAFNKDLTIYQAVQAAGGASEFGSLKRVKLYRNGKVLSYDLTNAQFMQVPLQPNDTLEVPQKNWLGQ
jgi:protein involved in polysaccharide export with SLBB domain